jgi:hypothetical protein
MNVHSEEILHKVSQWLAHADKGQAQKAVKAAQKVRKQVRTALAESGIDLPAEPEQ